MEYYTLSEIQDISKGIQRPLFENRSRLGRAKMTIFLSHSHSDRDIIEDIIAFFVKLNIDIYVDWLDPSMPAITSAETADKIKRKIKDLDKFVVLLTENSKNSKWVPWELGYADGVKNYGDIAIFPVLRSRFGNFDGVEYMGLYPQIKEGSNENRRGPAVLPPSNVSKYGKFLSDGWLSQKNIIY